MLENARGTLHINPPAQEGKGVQKLQLKTTETTQSVVYYIFIKNVGL